MPTGRYHPTSNLKAVFPFLLALLLATLACNFADDLLSSDGEPAPTGEAIPVTVVAPPTPPVFADDGSTPESRPADTREPEGPDTPVEPTPTPWDAPISSGGPALLPAPIYFLDPSGRIQRLERDLLTKSQVAAEPVPIDDFDVAPDGSFLVYLVDNRLVRIDTDSRQATVLLSAEPVGEEDFELRFSRQIGHPRISPDGSQVAFSQGGIQIVGAAPGNSPTMIQPSDPYPTDFSNIPQGPIRFFTGAEWSPTGDRLAVFYSYFPEGGDMAFYDLAQSRLIEPIRSENTDVTCCDLSWSADGSTAYVSSGFFVYLNPGISRIDTMTGEVTSILPGYPSGLTDLSGAVNRARAAHLAPDGSLLAFAAASSGLEISPYYLLQRVIGEGAAVTLEPVSGLPFELRGDIVWAPDGSGVLVANLAPGQPADNSNGSFAWHPLDGGRLDIPVYGRSPRWGGPPQPPELADPAGLIALAAADFGLPAEQVAVLPLAAPGLARLWAAHSLGMPPMIHQTGIYAYEGETWRPVATFTFDRDATPSGPDFIGPGSVRQAWLDAQSIWLAIDAFVGAHGGSFTLLRFDGQELSVAATSASGNPGAGRLVDLNGDGWQEVILERTDYYIFAYATGVRLIDLGLLRLEGGSLVETRLERLPETGGGPWRASNNRAVELAEAGLWIDANRVTDETMRLLLVASAPEPLLTWNAAYIRLMAYEMQGAANSSAYPLLQHVFAGDYWPVVGIMRDYSPDQIFNLDTPLIADTVAEGYREIVVDQILTRSNAALAVMPENAPAYFVRAWAIYLRDPGSPAIVADIQQALALSPGDPLFEESLEYLR